ncbi:B-cell receptor CD22-like isoform X2 [Dendropsophus ebraccatus]|uniref:B-cell receptor CD22-like isoform X2 n=1 Tax=Dendropsophus ebraccatus TaxID=150705 RepID=UPI0038310EF4
MEAVKQVYLLLICQGFYLGSVCQRWTFPSEFFALLGSCVEIPCTYDAGTSGASSTVWYLYSYIYTDPEILNTKDQSSVLEEYRNRTSLVPGEKSCTLRIDPVREEDGGREYYPGIAEDRNINADNKTVHLNTTDKIYIHLYGPEHVTEGEATSIHCVVAHTCGSSPPSLQWNKSGEVKIHSVLVFGHIHLQESRLTYIPSYVDDGTSLHCTATFPNGQRTVESITLNISYAAIGVHITVRYEEESIDLICDYLSSRPNVTHYTWLRDGSILFSNAGKILYLYTSAENYGEYTCIAHNPAGNSSSTTFQYTDEDFSITLYYIILPIAIGAICLLLLALLVYMYWRKKQKKMNSTVIDDTYTDLRLSDITEIYHQLEPVTPAATSAVRSDTGTNPDYENVRRPNI